MTEMRVVTLEGCKERHIAELMRIWPDIPVLEALYVAPTRTLCGLKDAAMQAPPIGDGAPICRVCARIAKRRGWI